MVRRTEPAGHGPPVPSAGECEERAAGIARGALLMFADLGERADALCERPMRIANDI